MRTPQLAAALALVAGMAVPAVLAAPAHAAASCTVTLYDIELSNPADKDGEDELSFKVGGNWYPQHGYVLMSNTHWDRNPGDFGNPQTIVTRTGNVAFNLREFDPPITTGGLDLGNAWAHGYRCDDLDEGETYVEQSVLKSSTWSYTVWLKLTGQ